MKKFANLTIAALLALAAVGCATNLDLLIDKRDAAAKKGDAKQVAEYNKQIDEQNLKDHIFFRDKAVRDGKSEEVAHYDKEIEKIKQSQQARAAAEQQEQMRQQSEQMHTIVQDAAAPVLIQREATAHGILR